jgi:hypothetical protein
MSAESDVLRHVACAERELRATIRIIAAGVDLDVRPQYGPLATVRDVFLERLGDVQEKVDALRRLEGL